jgi:hypothetical protein
MNNFIIEGDKITFLDARFYRSPEGIFCPSVTTYLSAFPKSAEFYSWLKKVGEDADTIRDDAGRRGSNVHHMVENYLKGLEISLIEPNTGNLAWSLAEYAMFERFVEFFTTHNPTILASEMQLIDVELLEAGTLDLLVELNGKKMILDIKTSNSIYDHYFLQLAAYKRMFERVNEAIDAVGILWLNAKTRTNGKGEAIQGRGWQLLSKDDVSRELELFDYTKQLWRVHNADAMPRQTSYQISYVRA